MSAMEETGGLLEGILAVTHPSLYNTGLTIFQLLSHTVPKLREIISAWPLIFNSCHIIVNRLSIHHRDWSTNIGWQDMLITLGTYGETGVMIMRNLGVTIPYDAGSVVMLSSPTVVHAVPQVPPDRISYALFMSDSTHDYVRQESPSWATVEDCIDL